MTEDSWFFFHVIGQEEDESQRWLGPNVQDWEEFKEYKLFKAFIHKIDVGNDRAECRVKLIQEYIASAHSEGDLQDLLLVVDEQKSKLSNLNKVVINHF